MRQILTVLASITLLATACSSGTNSGSDTGSPALPPATTTESTATTIAAVATTVTATTVTSTTIAVGHPEIPKPQVSDVASLLALDRPVVLAHAGGDQIWPHSTMYAFFQSALAGVDVLDMDVQLTGDGALVVQHDDTVDKATNGTGRVRDKSYENLQALDKAYWASDHWASHDLPDSSYIYRGIRTGDVPPPPGFSPDDFRIETWRNVATTFPDYPLNIEIKVPNGDNGKPDLPFAIDGARELAREITELGRTDSVIVTSFNDEVLAAFREAAPDVVTSPGISVMTDWIFGTEPLDRLDLVLQLPPSFQGITIITPALIARAHKDGISVWEWADGESQENDDFYSLMAAMGVDGINAGRPLAAVERFAAEAANPPSAGLLIVVTNDDGVDAPGINALVEALRALPDITLRVVAPADNQSGTFDRRSPAPPGWKYSLTAGGFPAIAVLGFPADSVDTALREFAWKPDLVIAGINDGQNIGPLVDISGTVGAARTAARAGVPALAASQGLGDPPDFASGVQQVLAWVKSFRNRPARPSEPTVTNFNVPTCTSGEVRGVATVDVATDAEGRNVLVSDCVGNSPDVFTDDIDAFMNGWATLSTLGY